MKNIEKLRCEFHLSQKYMAKYLGIDISSYAEMELGNREPSSDEIAKLNKIFGVTLDNTQQGNRMSRYIDADILIEDLEYDVKIDQDSLDHEDLSEINRDLTQTDKDIKQNAIDILKHAPTADVVPVRHGHWIDTGSGQECSVCGEIQYGYDSGRRYCPNCGAKMQEQIQFQIIQDMYDLGFADKIG